LSPRHPRSPLFPYTTLFRSISGDRVFRRTALGAMRHALARAEDIEPPARVGLYSGWLGLSLAALKVADLLNEDSLRAPAIRLVKDRKSTRLNSSHSQISYAV